MSGAAAQRSRLPRRAFVEWAALSILLSALALTLGAQVGLGRIDLLLYDTAQSLRARTDVQDIVIVAIDDESLNAIGRWPWRRAILATVLERIAAAKPRALGIDLILSELDERDPGGDAALARVLADARGVVLPVAVQSYGTGGPQQLLPASPFRTAGAQLAHVQVEPDTDGAVRSIYLSEGLPDAPWPAFSLALSGGTLADKMLPGERRASGPAPAGLWLRDHRVHIEFSGPPGTIRRVPAAALLTGAEDSAALAGKYVLVGATATGLGDAYPTPLTGNTELMPGVEVQAQALNAILHGRTSVLAAPAANALYTLLPVLIAMAGFVLLAPQLWLGLLAGLLALTLASSVALLTYGQVWYPPAAAAMLLVVAYPLWSWRRLEAVMRFLGGQFEQLEREPALIPRASQAAGARFSDVLGRQIAAVRNAADRLREARRFIADSLDGLPVATLVSGTDECVLIANKVAADVFGAEANDALRGKTLDALFQQLAPDNNAIWPDARRALQQSGHAELEFMDVRGRSFRLHGVVSIDSAGNRAGLLLTLVDLSAIRDAQRRRDDALSFLSHDIRSPQASILAVAELHGLDPQNYPADTALEKIQAYAHTTIALTEQFVQLSRVETQTYQLADCDLCEIAREAVDGVRMQAVAKSIQVEFTGDTPSYVTVDRALIARVIVNLANNAVKYSPKDTTVTVAVSVTPEGASLSVRDRGYGISDKDQQRLFQRFARFSTEGQPKEKGLGLGLAFVQTVIERHRGRMKVTSKIGEGSEFGFVLPAAASGANAAANKD